MRTSRHVIASPVSGTGVPLEEVDDAVLSSGVLGEGWAVEPRDGTVLAPIDGVVTRMARTKHAFCMRGDDGTEVLVHIGIDTVRLGGAPFEALAHEGDRLPAGGPVLSADLDEIRGAGLSALTAVIVCGDEDERVDVVAAPGGDVRAGRPLIEVRRAAEGGRGRDR